MAVEIRSPIFILGCPRSGTSVLYEKLAQHPDVACISRATKKMPSSLLATRLLLLFRRNFKPTEAENVWGRFCHGDDHALGADDATPRARRYLHAVVRTHLALFGKSRFLAKCPRNSVRVGFLDAVFPDAVFVHIVRDGRAVAYSIARSRAKEAGEYWGTRPPGWRKLLGMPVLEASALQWKLITEHALRSAQALPPERYVEIRYEEFTARPAETLDAIAAKCGLAWDQDRLRALVADIESRNYKWRENLSPDEVARLNELIGDLLLRLGYEL